MALPQMEVLGLQTSVSLSRQTWRRHLHHRFYFTYPLKISFLPGYSFQFPAGSRNPELLSLQTSLSPRIRGFNASEQLEEEDIVENPAFSSTVSSGDDYGEDDESSVSTFLSLSEKPDRNLALLDDYELEELDFASNPNHRSGTFSFAIVLNFISAFYRRKL